MVKAMTIKIEIPDNIVSDLKSMLLTRKMSLQAYILKVIIQEIEVWKRVYK